METDGRANVERAKKEKIETNGIKGCKWEK